MKKILTIILLIASVNSFSQTTKIFNTLYNDGASFGKKDTEIIYTTPKTPLLYFNGYGNFPALNSDSVTEGSTNLYFTNARARAAISYSGQGYLSYNSSTGVLTGSQINLTTNVTNVLPVANGGTGTTTPGIVAGTNITVTGTWPNQTVNSSGGGGSGWSKTGDVTVTPLANYIGINDASSQFRIKTNGQIRASFDSASGRVYLDSLPIWRGAVGTGANAGNRMQNIGIGDSSLNKPNALGGNTALGYFALARDSTQYNTAIGFQSQWKTTTGSQNTSVGANSLEINTTGQQNTAVGYGSMIANTTGGGNNHGNVAMGYNSMAANTTGGDNTAIGAASLATNQTNSYQTAIGSAALTANNSYYNTAVGAGACQGCTGNTNTVMGTFALQGSFSGNTNTVIGYSTSGTTGITTGSKNTLIGANIVGLASGLSNTIVLADGDGNQRYYTNSSGQTGLKYTSPSATLQLSPGTTSAGTAPLKLTYITLATTATSGNGATAVLTFAAQSQPPFAVGNTIVVAGVTPSGYNGTYTVTACTTTTVSYSNTTTGAQTVAGTAIAGQLLTTPEPGAIEYDGTHFYGTDNAGTRHQLDN